MEIWDILDRDGNKTGRTVERGKVLKEGEYHLVVHIYIINKKGEYLIQKRSMKKELMPGIWDITGGSVVSGEDSLTAAIREVKEELGISLSTGDISLIAKLQREHSLVDIYAAHVDISIGDVIMQDGEVDEVKFVSPGDMVRTVFEAEYRDESYKEILMNFIKGSSDLNEEIRYR